MSNDDREESWDEGLKPKERLFCLHYCCDVETFLNSAGSYRKTYTKYNRKTKRIETPDDKSCECCGSRMRNKPRVKEAIRKLLAQTQAELDEENTYKVLAEIQSLAFFNPADILNTAGKLKTKSLTALGEKAKAIAQIKPGKYGTEITLVNKSKYIELLSKYLELVRPEQQIEVTLPVIELPSKAETDEDWNEED